MHFRVKNGLVNACFRQPFGNQNRCLVTLNPSNAFWLIFSSLLAPLWAPFWPRLERFWLPFRSFCLLGAALAPLWVPFSLILHRLAFILERFGLHPLFLAPQSAKYCKIDLGNQISYKVLLAILSSTGPSGGTIAASNREESCL